MSGQRIFVTGGASGLGRAIAERYARAGWKVCVGDVHAARLEETLASLEGLGAGAHALSCDVTREEDLEAAAAWLTASWGGVDVVVNNAGVAASGSIADTPLADWQWILDVNLLGVVRGCRVFTPLFRRQGHGRFVNVASVAAFVHPPMISAYAATKAAVLALSESIAVELARDGIGVTVVCPGLVRTNLAETSRAATPRIDALARAFISRARVTPEEVAEKIYHGVARGRFLVQTHPEGRLIVALKRLLPAPLYLKLMERLARKLLPRRRSATGPDEPAGPVEQNV
ncbi:MAG: SDR family oxidoreductase [Acidobacteria bacterium]|nr:MAG: SDR family oxidoreductase [Acidobacteriota bacterium]MCE7957195.1 SDR family oxidoreductase [Acidobacteria bacterium ACB2]